MHLSDVQLRYKSRHLGKHKCPREYIKGDFQTSYASQYKDYKVIPTAQTERYRYSERHYNPEVLRTNYQATYVPLEATEKTMSVSRLGSIGVFALIFREKFLNRSLLLGQLPIKRNSSLSRSR